MDLPEFMIHQSFRYVLGRKTYAVGLWCDWCVKNFDKIPADELNLIVAELEDAFKRDDKARLTGSDLKPLGHDCDRKEWERVRELYK